MIRSRVLASTLTFALLSGASLPALAQQAAQPAATTAPVAASTARAAPPLVVTIVVDQFSANLFSQYRSRFTGGLKTLADQGLVHVNGYQTHGLTETCPGHSTILTGMHPTETGILANDWVDPATGKEVYCLAAPQNTLAHGKNTDNGPVGPDQLMVSTLADWLKEKNPQSRIFAVSGKDRGAINLNGHKGDGAYWFTDGFGLTTYVEPGQSAEARLAPVAAFNARFRAMSEASNPAPYWTGAFSDCQGLDGDWTIRGQTFRAAVPPANPVFDTSPALDEATLVAAADLLQSQQLGRRGTTDMLGVSLSATDRIGHSFGTQGPEMCEQMHRLDAALGLFLNKLPEGTLVVLTADHGGSDFVERLHDHGYPHAHRADLERVARVNLALKERFNLEVNPLQQGGSGLMVAGRGGVALADPLRTEVANAAVEMLKTNPEIAFVATRDAVLTDPIPASDNPDMLTLRERARLSAVAGRSPDILIFYAQNVVPGGSVGRAISGHGTPFDYDRRVPIIFWTKGAEGLGQERFLPIRTLDIAPTLAHVMGVTAPKVEGRCIDLPGFATGRCETVQP
ncbi:alkaline phosphatase family protein [Brevundimonas sp.]|uniref:alkaline phosphatase family protein n=1 Tax=Brevundimonas sp. TaxID=1871086 RepID=UPI002ED89EEA